MQQSRDRGVSRPMTPEETPLALAPEADRPTSDGPDEGTAAPATAGTAAPNLAHPSRRTTRVVAVLFAMFLLLLGEIALTGSPAPVDAAYPHSLRAVTGEGCGGG
jgi:hypothetical protein